jgi:hypothetical protein
MARLQIDHELPARRKAAENVEEALEETFPAPQTLGRGSQPVKAVLVRSGA